MSYTERFPHRSLDYARGPGAPMTGEPAETIARGPLPTTIPGSANVQSGPRHHAPHTTQAIQRKGGGNPEPWMRRSAGDPQPSNAAAPHVKFGASRTGARSLKQDEVQRIGTPHEVHANAAAPHRTVGG